MKQTELKKHFDAYAQIKTKAERDKYYIENILPILNNENAEEFTDTLLGIKSEAKALKDNILFQDVMNGINLAYIAEHYFGKSKSWLYHRIKGSTINGKRVYFDDIELMKLQDAFDDMGKKLQQLSNSLI